MAGRMVGGLLVLGVSLAAGAGAGVASAQTVTLVSVTGGGTQGDAPSGPNAAVSANGRYVVFTSAATNLVTGDTNSSIDVFLKDRQTGAVTRISLAPDDTERTGDSGVDGLAMSDDGDVIAFASRAALLASDTNTCPPVTNGATGPSCSDIYVYTRSTDTLVRASVSAGGVEADGPSREPSLTANGSHVAFTSQATNLIAGDTNGASDIFLRTLASTEIARISLSGTGAQGDRGSSHPRLTDDGQMLAFLSEATNFADSPNTLNCDPARPCARAFVRSLATGAIARIPALGGGLEAPPSTTADVEISGDGRYVASSEDVFLTTSPNYMSHTSLYDRVTGESRTVFFHGGGAGAVLSGNGRFLVANRGVVNPSTNVGKLLDRVLDIEETLAGSDPTAPTLANPTPPNPGRTLDFSPDGRFLVMDRATDLANAGDANGVADIFIVDFDADADGMRTSWETLFGLNPSDATDGGLDPDADGLTSAQEYQTNGHPNGVFKRYFAEGARNAFFSTGIGVFNPGGTLARVQLRYLGSDGTESRQVGIAESLTAFRPLTSRLVTPPENFSTVIESDQPIVADRRMTWGGDPNFDSVGQGSSGERAIEAPSTVWYLAEGATHGWFDLFYLLQNANNTDVEVTIEYLRPAPAPPVVRQYTVAAHSRRTIWVDAEGPDLEATDVSAKITSTLPIIVERSMYYSLGQPLSRSFVAGHNGAGVTAPETQWFLAEGATGAFFDLFVLIANPGDTDAELEISYLLPDGAAPVKKPYTVAARSRRTIWVAGEDPRLAGTAVATLVTSTNGQPVIVERAMWWPAGNWYEAHLSAGATTTGTRWAFANGRTTVGPGLDTYVLIANTSPIAGTATVTLYPGLGGPTPRTVQLPANSRVNLRIRDMFDPYIAMGYAVVVESDGVQIVVERAEYQTFGVHPGWFWSSGMASLATKLQ
jgi:Tol biopolymer transport system component